MALECDKHNSNCLNTIGSFECTCPKGFRKQIIDQTQFKCIDIDECKEGIHNCKNGSICQNSVGTFSCKCTPGYKWSLLKETCEDIDECSQNLTNTFSSNDLCDENSVCLNTNGSFNCACNLGWAKNKNNYCHGKIQFYRILIQIL